MNRGSRECLCVNLPSESISRNKRFRYRRPNQEFPQANAQDFICYREFADLDYAMPAQREGGVTWRELSSAR